MKRRSFLTTVMGAAAVVVAPVSSLLDRIVPARFVEALRARFYPGPVARIDDETIRKPGNWAG